VKSSPPGEDAPNIHMRVHDADAVRVDGVLRLIEAAGRSEPLPVVLRDMVEQVRRIAHADVVSVYVRERASEGERLVMRANVGFPASAIGHVKLALGEGITGTAAEIMRPISCSIAQEDSHYKHFPELGEEKYPSLVAVPFFARGVVAGVLVLQRGEAGAFSDAEVALATVLAPTFSHAFERAGAGESVPSRSARLTGQGLVPGVALGRVVMLGTLEALREPVQATRASAQSVEVAFQEVVALLRKASVTLRAGLDGADRRELDSLVLTLDDQRLRDTMLELTTQFGSVRGLRQLARQYATSSFHGADGDPFLEHRAIEVESLCLLVATRASGYPLPAGGAILVVAEHLSAFSALAVVAGGGAGVVAAGALESDALGPRLVAAAGLPVVADVAGLFTWVRPGDTLRVDGATGVVRVNPPATAIRRHRRESNATALAPEAPARGGDGSAEVVHAAVAAVPSSNGRKV
jgi:phosphotransferase system enzyme I (PtsP)